MSSRSLELLHPELRSKCLLFMSGCLEAGLHPLVTSTGRTPADQEALWAQGRLPLDLVNKRRLKLGWALLTEAQNKKVTWTTQSKHIIDPTTGFCSAFDFCLTKAGKAYWDVKASVDGDEIPDYQEAGLIGVSLGLSWGGSWAKPDFPHLQLDP